MALSPGTRLGSYDIIGALGAGGMGEVYRATDGHLKRSVAIKVLPASVAGDGDRLARFQREAEVLAALNHPNIGAIYGLEKTPDLTALVMELVEGEDLSAQIALGPIAPADALPLAKQIADALEAAHEQGIVHRDLKPANIKVRADGAVKVLDFGLARTIDGDGAGRPDGSRLSLTATVTAVTEVGMILGTAGYMSPEQATGRPADRRADVWAFGVVVFEMLSGRRPFDGDTVSERLASVLKTDPDWRALPATVPPGLRRLLRACLVKDPKRRLQAIGDARVQLEDLISGTPDDTVATPEPPPRRRGTAVAGAALAAGAAATLVMWALGVFGTATPPPPVTRFVLPLADGERFTNGDLQALAIAPDGSRVAYVANNQLYLRSMSEPTGRVVPGTDLLGGVRYPAFSPDGQSIVFGTPHDNTLKRVAIGGGTPATIASDGGYLTSGISWGPGGIVFVAGTAVVRVSPNGGTADTLFEITPGEQVSGPRVLPGGETILFTLARTEPAPNAISWNIWDRAQVVAQSLTTGTRKVLVDGGADARYLESGHLVYARGGTLYAVAFDRRRVEVTGPPVPVLEGVGRSTTAATAHVSVSENGTIVYVPGPVTLVTRQLDLGLIDSAGLVVPLKLPPANYTGARLSPDGTQVAIGSDDGVEAVVWVSDLAGTRSLRRLTFDGNNRFPVWSADGRRVTFQSDRGGDLAIYGQHADGSRAAERLTTPDGPGVSHVPEAWSPTGDTLLFRVTKDGTASLWTLSAASGTTAPFSDVVSEGPTDAAFSPDGRWVAYSVGTSAASQLQRIVYVQPFPATGAKYRISQENGRHQLWSRDGRQLLYVVPGANRYAVVRVTTQPVLSFTHPEMYTRAFRDGLGDPTRTFDLAADGRILGVIEASLTPQIGVVLNWFEELRRLVPTK